MESFLRKHPEGHTVGVVRAESGQEFVYNDLAAFAVEAGAAVPPYLNFITRPKPTVTNSFDFAKLPLFTQTSLLPFQRVALEMLVRDHDGRSIIAADTGCGKTLMGCAGAKHYGGTTLFIVTKGKLRDWVQDYYMWIGHDDIQVVEDKFPGIRSNIVMMTYERAKKCKEVLAKKWSCVVLDECQHIKTETSQCSKALIPMLARAGAVILLSATPQENNPMELFNPLHALYPYVFKDRAVFAKHYTRGRLNKWGRWEQEEGGRNTDELNLLLTTTMFRITKKEALPNLPPITRYIARLDCEGKDLATLNALQTKRVELQRASESARDQREADRINMQRNAHKMLMHRTNGEIKGRVGKDWMDSFIADHPDDKILFFAEYHETIKRLEASIKACSTKPPYVIITGKTNLKKRAEHILAIADPKGPAKVAILMVKACGTGITLSPGASIVVMCELDHVPSNMEQCEGRVSRIGAVKPAEIYWWVLNNSTDDGTVAKLQTKMRVNGAVLDGNKKAKFNFE
jgi:SNF2 family DNA or RNA helicase